MMQQLSLWPFSACRILCDDRVRFFVSFFFFFFSAFWDNRTQKSLFWMEVIRHLSLLSAFGCVGYYVMISSAFLFLCLPFFPPCFQSIVHRKFFFSMEIIWDLSLLSAFVQWLSPPRFSYKSTGFEAHYTEQLHLGLVNQWYIQKISLEFVVMSHCNLSSHAPTTCWNFNKV